MSVVEVREVSLAGASAAWGCTHRIDAPVQGTEENVYAFSISGWVLGRIARVVSVEPLHDGRPLRTIPVDGCRPDVASLYPGHQHAERCGFSSWVGVVSLPQDFEIALRAVLEDGRHVPLGTIRGRKEPVRSGFDARLQPLMITSLGRTGTTWLMRLLAEHREVVAHRRYPYETRSASYWMHMLKILAEPANHSQSAHPDNFQYNPWVGHHPGYLPRQVGLHLGVWFGRSYVEQLARFCQSSIEQFYREVASVQHQAEPKYFAEKFTPGPVPWTVWGLYPQAREIILVRDFRDMVSSIYATNAKRGTADFGRGQSPSDEAYVHGLARQAKVLVECWRRRSPMTHLVRYEDLIRRPTETLQAVFEYLGIDAGDVSIQMVLQRALEETPELRQHRTSPSALSSIGRWKADLPVSLRPVCESAFAEVLQECGYE